MLRWEKQPDGQSYFAKRGQVVVGMVVQREDGIVVWQISAVHTKWICKGYGETTNTAYAKRTLARNWQTWCDVHGLVPEEAA